MTNIVLETKKKTIQFNKIKHNLVIIHHNLNKYLILISKIVFLILLQCKILLKNKNKFINYHKKPNQKYLLFKIQMQTVIKKI